MQVPDPGCSGTPKTAKAVPDPAPLHWGRGSRRADSSHDEARVVTVSSKNLQRNWATTAPILICCGPENYRQNIDFRWSSLPGNPPPPGHQILKYLPYSPCSRVRCERNGCTQRRLAQSHFSLPTLFLNAVIHLCSASRSR